MLEIKWMDKDTNGIQNIHITHHMDGLNLKLFMYMLEIQLIHNEKDIVVRAGSETIYGDMIYHLSREQAQKVWQSFDGYTYDSRVEFESVGIRWEDWKRIQEEEVKLVKKLAKLFEETIHADERGKAQDTLCRRGHSK